MFPRLLALLCLLFLSQVSLTQKCEATRRRVAETCAARILQTVLLSLRGPSWARGQPVEQPGLPSSRKIAELIEGLELGGGTH